MPVASDAIEAVLGPVILNRIGPAAAFGLHWYHARPPIADLEFEVNHRRLQPSACI